MASIKLQTTIQAPAAECFSLSLDAEIHTGSMAHTGERAIEGRSSGLFQLGDTVTWEARHLGFRQRLQVQITALSFPTHFRDEMIRGPFKLMRHDHYFLEAAGITEMRDHFYYEMPFGIIGWLFDQLYLRHYMRRLLQRRNAFIGEQAALKNIQALPKDPTRD
jgi:ligand-binding SRPBCC domain-containing protein